MGIGIRRYKPCNVYTPCKTTVTSFDDVSSSEQFLSFLKMKNIQTVPVDFDSFFKEVTNISWQTQSLGDAGISGSLCCIEDPTWVIVTNSDQHPRRQRFTVAHELGHYCLHRNREYTFEDTIFFRQSTPDSMDWQANRFAVEILMPEVVMREYWLSSTKVVLELAEKLNVPILAVRLRLEQLNLI